MRKCEKYSTASQAIDNIERVHCMLYNKGYKKKLRICNTAFPRQQWLQERASMLCYTYIGSLVLYYSL